MPEQTPGTALSLPENVRADLLRAQMGAISTSLDLPRVKIMAAGVGMYEFTDTNDTVREFEGVVLGSHSRNALWKKKFGAPSRDEEDKYPACSSRDGVYGTPAEGFPHAALGGAEAVGTELIECATCPYNQFGSGAMLIPDKNPRGKAVSNQKSVYIMVADRMLPVELVLPAMSIIPFDKYLGQLLNRSMPVQAVLTKFSQTIDQQKEGSAKYGTPKFEVIRSLEQDEFADVLTKMARFKAAIDPSSQPVVVNDPSVGNRDELDADTPF